ncbi:GntR family transcriptional regulator [Balneatrix alpica]|uniref:GntR family transcriptional regulator n=1 Tax=Balneatrix alpica TaxID=75684 RepID=A0ABV5ZC50_9GAMM|nr:GntR family transcriptional regulator [Balneatrix alpica]
MAKPAPIHKTRTQIVAEILRDKILTGEIQAGTPLRQDALAKELNVSRIPVREALLLLEAQGLVEFEPHKGATATELSVDTIHELFELRALIECEVLAQAIPHMTELDFKRAEDILTAFDHALDTGTRVENWSELNQQLHAALYRAANKPLAMELIDTLNTRSDRYIRMQLLLTKKVEKAEKEHRELLDLCKAKDSKKAVTLLRKHILEAGQAIEELLRSQQGN